jgi:predicted PurR-regulated permease PerM
VHVTARTVFAIFAAIALGIVAKGVLHDARRALGWFFAAGVVAVLIDGPVDLLSRWMRRGFAVVLVLIAIGGLTGLVSYGVFNDLSSELRKLEREVPKAAEELERSEQFGEVARDLELVDRAHDAVDGLGERLSGRARATAASFGAYFAGTVLVLFLLAWLPRFIEGGLAQIADDARRARVRVIVESTLRTARRYLSVAVLVAAGSGFIAFGVARLASLPAPVALGLFVAIFSFVPYLGVAIGAIPMVLLAAGLESSNTALGVLFGVLALQFGCALAMRSVQRTTLYVGPGISLVVGLLGYAAYNIGGALFGIAAAVFALALVDTAAADEVALDALDALTII